LSIFFLRKFETLSGSHTVSNEDAEVVIGARETSSSYLQLP